MSERTALIIGATGLVGNELLKSLLVQPYYEKIKVVARKPLKYSDPRLEVILIEDFDRLGSMAEQLEAEDYFCTLGTTIKKAGSREAFRKVDFVYPIALAEIAKNFPSFRSYSIVTAAGSNAVSPFFYNRVKGEVEQKLQELALSSLKIFRPSLLIGDRNEFRLGEEFAKKVTRFFSLIGIGKLWSIEAVEVARAMYIAATEAKPGFKVYSSSEMVEMSKTLRI